MLYGYPVAATQDNWLHDCLCEAVRTIHALANASKRYPKWPKIIPHACQSLLESRTGLRDRLKAYDRAVRKLPTTDRAHVLLAVDAENEIPGLLSGACDCAAIDDLPTTVREPVVDLFEFAFDLLREFDVRERQYTAIIGAVPAPVFPFCGTEPFDQPGAPLEALDHYLPKSRYPFAAANLRNLVPMGRKCNSSYKLAKDLLRRLDGSRRVAVDPYNHPAVSVSLDESAPFGGVTQNTPSWKVVFEPDSPALSTWDEVFSVRDRYCRDNLDPSFSNWLGLFRYWARVSSLPLDTDADLVAALRRFEEFWGAEGLNDRAFLKAAVFRMLRRHCEAGHDRLLAQIRMLVAPVAPPIGPLPASRVARVVESDLDSK